MSLHTELQLMTITSTVQVVGCAVALGLLFYVWVLERKRRRIIDKASKEILTTLDRIIERLRAYSADEEPRE